MQSYPHSYSLDYCQTKWKLSQFSSFTGKRVNWGVFSFMCDFYISLRDLLCRVVSDFYSFIKFLVSSHCLTLNSRNLKWPGSFAIVKQNYLPIQTEIANFHQWNASCFSFSVLSVHLQRYETAIAPIKVRDKREYNLASIN